MKIDKDLTQYNFLLHLSTDSYALLEKYAKIYIADKEQMLIYKGDKVGGVYLIEQGGLKVFNMDAKGKENTLYWVYPGESCLLAMNCVFADIIYPAWVKNGQEKTKIIIIPSEIYKKLYEKETIIRDFSFKILSKRVFDLMTNLEENLAYSLEQKVASFLIRKANIRLEVHCSHQIIATELGSAREVISRILKQFEKKEIIQLTRGCIYILNKQKLTEIL